MKKEYIVGVDFGYDVTSAWIVSLFDDNLYGESLKLKPTNRESEKSYYSIIYYNPKYGYSLGTQILAMQKNGNTNLR